MGALTHQWANVNTYFSFSIPPFLTPQHQPKNMNLSHKAQNKKFLKEQSFYFTSSCSRTLFSSKLQNSFFKVPPRPPPKKPTRSSNGKLLSRILFENSKIYFSKSDKRSAIW